VPSPFASPALADRRHERVFPGGACGDRPERRRQDDFFVQFPQRLPSIPLADLIAAVFGENLLEARRYKRPSWGFAVSVRTTEMAIGKLFGPSRPVADVIASEAVRYFLRMLHAAVARTILLPPVQFPISLRVLQESGGGRGSNNSSV